MSTLGSVLTVIGYLVAAAGGIWIIVIAFQDSIVWGLGCLFVPCVQLIYAITHWEDTKVPFLINIGGCVLVALGTAVKVAAASG